MGKSSKQTPFSYLSRDAVDIAMNEVMQVKGRKGEERARESVSY